MSQPPPGRHPRPGPAGAPPHGPSVDVAGEAPTSGRGRLLILVAAIVAAVVLAGVGVAVLSGSDDRSRPEAAEGTVTRLAGGGEDRLDEDPQRGRRADLGDVLGFGVGPDGLVAVASDGLDVSTWLMDPDRGDLRELDPSGGSVSAGDPLVEPGGLLTPSVSDQALAFEVPPDGGDSTPVGPSPTVVRNDQFVFGSLTRGTDDALWRTYRIPPLVRRHADGKTTTVDLSEEGCDDAAPHGLAGLPDGSVVVADPGCRELWTVSPEGEVAPLGPLPECPEGAGAMIPTDVAVAGDQLIVADRGCSLVWTGNLDGADLTPLVGAPGRAPNSLPDDRDDAPLDEVELQAPAGVEVDADGRLYVLDGGGADPYVLDEVAESPTIWVSAPGLVG